MQKMFDIESIYQKEFSSSILNHNQIDEVNFELAKGNIIVSFDIVHRTIYSDNNSTAKTIVTFGVPRKHKRVIL